MIDTKTFPPLDKSKGISEENPFCEMRVHLLGAVGKLWKINTSPEKEKKLKNISNLLSNKGSFTYHF